jgi:hypothetical protein
MFRQLHAIGQFWLDRWNATSGIGGLRAIDTQELIAEAAGDHQVPNASLNGPTATSVTRERAKGFHRGCQNVAVRAS